MDTAFSTALVRCLVRSQFPDWGDLAVSAVELDGWDNTTFRLGETMSVRLPSADGYVAQVEKEHRWLPILAKHLPLTIPQPIGRGEPSCDYPWPWSVYRWLDGEPASHAAITNLDEFARSLAAFLGALYDIDPSGGPPAGPANFYRGGQLSTYDRETRNAISELAVEIDAEQATRMWELALKAEWSGRKVWVHGDVAPSNLLVVNGELDSVIDFGCAAVGDPACDTVIAWTFFFGSSREAFRAHLPVDEPTWIRGRGWALWKALITHSEGRRRHSREVDTAALRFGWRHSARLVLADLLSEPA